MKFIVLCLVLLIPLESHLSTIKSSEIKTDYYRIYSTVIVPRSGNFAHNDEAPALDKGPKTPGLPIKGLNSVSLNDKKEKFDNFINLKNYPFLGKHQHIDQLKTYYVGSEGNHFPSLYRSQINNNSIYFIELVLTSELSSKEESKLLDGLYQILRADTRLKK